MYYVQVIIQSNILASHCDKMCFEWNVESFSIAIFNSTSWWHDWLHSFHLIRTILLTEPLDPWNFRVLRVKWFLNNSSKIMNVYFRKCLFLRIFNVSVEMQTKFLFLYFLELLQLFRLSFLVKLTRLLYTSK